MKAIVTGMIATYPVGGVLWDYIQYAVGLERLGFEVYYLEDCGLDFYNPDQGVYGSDASVGADFLEKALLWVSPTLAKRWHLRSNDDECFGMTKQEMLSAIQDADVFLNVSGSALLREEYIQSKRKVLIDTDPGWNHFVNYPKWDKQPGWKGAHSFREHDYFLTYAKCLGQTGCVLPALGLAWETTWPPVVLDFWESEPPAEKWTTVMTWNNFRRTIEYQGKCYGTKEKEFDKIAALPSEISVSLEIAVGGQDAPREQWRRQGWSVIDSHHVSRTPEEYRTYIQSSRGELSIAKNVYVDTHSGWFSCRSICYLASGRPVVVQDTGFSSHIPCGEGLFAFQSAQEAKKAIDSVEHDYTNHQEAAKRVARDYFSSDIILKDLLDKIRL